MYCGRPYDGTNRRVCDASQPVLPQPVKVPLPVEPCPHLGAPVRGPDAPDLTRDYRRCDHPDQPLGAVVCSCKGCGPTCPGYPKD